MMTLRPVARAMRASARGSRPSVFGVGSTTVRPPARWNNRISSWATCSSRSRRLSRLALKFWRTQPRFDRLTGSHARPLSLAAGGSANITLKSIRRCSCGRVTPIASGATAPSTVWICPASGPGMRGSPRLSPSVRPRREPGHEDLARRLPERGRALGAEPIEVATQLVQRTEHARNEDRVDPSGSELIELVADLVRRTGQAGVTGVGGVAAHALGDGVGEPLDLVLPVGDEQRHVDRAPDGLRVATDCGAVLVEDLPFPRRDTRAAPDVPVVGVLGDDTQGDALAPSADHQFGVRRLDGLGIERGVGELVITPFESGAAFGPQRPDHLTGFVQPLEPLAQCVEGKAIGLVLVLLPARAEPEEEAAAGDDVDLRGHLRDHRRMAIRVPQHDGADAEAWHQGGQPSERAPRFEHGALALLRVRHEVVGDAGDVPPGRLEMSPEVQHARPGLAAHTREQTETHVFLLFEFDSLADSHTIATGLVFPSALAYLALGAFERTVTRH